MNQKLLKAHCNTCRGERLHDLLAEENTNWEEVHDADYSVSGSDKYEMLKCRGCESIKLRHTSWFSESDIDQRGDLIPSITYYPPASSRQRPDWFGDLFHCLPFGNNFVEDLLQEIYVALQNNCTRLAICGIRALIEQVMIDKVGDHGTFKKNLDQFKDKGFISQSQRDLLEPILEAGHAAIHRTFNLPKREVEVVIDIVESLIETVYVNEIRKLRIKTTPPPRAKAKGADKDGLK